MTLSLSQRKRRSQARGAAVFVVALAIVLLSSLGAWAMQSASMVDQAAGFSRAAQQTQYVAELGINAGTTLLSVPGVSGAQYLSGLTKPDSCEATPGQSSGRFCRSLWLDDMNKLTLVPLLDMGTTSAIGSLGSPSEGPGAVQGRFTVEMTDPERAIVPGSDVTKSQYYRVTLTSRGQVRPATGAADAACVGASNSVAGRVGVRAHTILGPI